MCEGGAEKGVRVTDGVRVNGVRLWEKSVKVKRRVKVWGLTCERWVWDGRVGKCETKDSRCGRTVGERRGVRRVQGVR